MSVYAIIVAGALVYGPAAWSPQDFSVHLVPQGVNASLPVNGPSSPLCFAAGPCVVPVTDIAPSYDPASQSLSQGAPVVSGQTVTIPYTVSSLTADQIAAKNAAAAAASAAALARTVNAQFNAALGAGLTITSAGNAALNGTYAVDDVSRTNIIGEWAYYNSTNKTTFTTGQATVTWADVNGLSHTFSGLQFVAFAQAVAVYYRALETTRGALIAGATVPWPTPSAIIP